MSRKSKTVLERFWHSLVGKLGCSVCSRFLPSNSKREHHHTISTSEFSIVVLCAEHHRGKTGLHGMSPPRFCSVYGVPGGTELGLLVWLLEDLACYVKARLGWKVWS